MGVVPDFSDDRSRKDIHEMTDFTPVLEALVDFARQQYDDSKRIAQEAADRKDHAERTYNALRHAMDTIHGKPKVRPAEGANGESVDTEHLERVKAAKGAGVNGLD